MYKVLVDTNIILDFMLQRQPFYDKSEKVIALCEEKKINGYVTTSILMDLHYIIKRITHSNADADMAINEITKVFNVIDISKKDIENSILEHSRDFEDFVIQNCCNRNSIDYIVTRNTKDFVGRKTKIVEPSQLLDII